MFTGFPQETFRFFMDIKFHNSVTYYNENKERYLSDVQAPFYAFIEDMIPAMQEIDPQMEIRPYKLLARLRRDTRFTKDKSPYRDHLWITFRRAAEPREGSINYWFELGQARLSWGLGFWGENRAVMDRFRREIAADPARVSGIISSCGLASSHLMLGTDIHKRMEVPANVPPHLANWYRAKELAVYQTFPDHSLVSSREILVKVQHDFRTLAPIYRMLRGMMDDVNAEAAAIEQAAAPKRLVHKDEW